MTEDEQNILADMFNSHAWKLYLNRNKEMIEEFRRLATQPKILLEDRLWYSALAQGREDAINEFKKML